MPIEIRSAGLDDVDSVVELCSSALSGNLDQDMCHPPDPETGRFTASTADWMTKTFERFLKSNPLGIIWKAVDTDMQDWTVAAAIWVAPASHLNDSHDRDCFNTYCKSAPLPLPPTARVDICEELHKEIQRTKKRVWNTRGDHWYLRILITHPSYQRQGIGRKLLEWGIEQAKNDHVPIYFVSTPKALPLYKSCGAEVVGESAHFDGTFKYRYCKIPYDKER